MRKNRTLLSAVSLLLVMSLLAACGSSVADTEAADAAIPENAIVYNITVDEQGTVDANEEFETSYLRYDNEWVISSARATTIDLEFGEAEMPYYVGMQDSSFLASVAYDQVIYINKKHYIPDMFEGCTQISVEDSSVLTIDGNYLIGKTQGVTNVYVETEDGTTTCYAVACTTYNDGRDIKNEYEGVMKTIGSSAYAYSSISGQAELYKDSVNTIIDCIDWFITTGFVYGQEPQNPTEADNDEDYQVFDPWMWQVAAPDIMEYGSGVCVQIAQVAGYLLADDFEDWGYILVNGKEGHIFNWYYEDGYYYVFDFTTVAGAHGDPKQFNSGIKQFYTVSELTKWIEEEKVNLDNNVNVIMYSALGHDYQPPYRLGCYSGCSNTEKEMKFSFEECVFEQENFHVLYENPVYTGVIIYGTPSEDLPYNVKASATGSYGIDVVSYHVNY